MRYIKMRIFDTKFSHHNNIIRQLIELMSDCRRVTWETNEIGIVTLHKARLRDSESISTFCRSTWLYWVERDASVRHLEQVKPRHTLYLVVIKVDIHIYCGRIIKLQIFFRDNFFFLDKLMILKSRFYIHILH